MADVIVGELVHGIGDSGVRCGVIGEVGCSWPLADSERRSLQAAALAQQETGEGSLCSPAGLRAGYGRRQVRAHRKMKSG